MTGADLVRYTVIAVLAVAPLALLVLGVVLRQRGRQDAIVLVIGGAVWTLLEVLFIWFVTTTTFPPPS